MFQRRLKCLSNRFWTKSPVIRNVASVNTIIPNDDVLDKLRMPKFEFPWPSACSPHVDRIGEETFQWGIVYNLMPNVRYQDRVKRTYYERLVSRCHPRVDYTLLRAINDFMVWLVLTDDILIDRVETVNIQHLTSIVDILDFNNIGDEEYYGKTALVDVCQRLRVQLSNEHYQRFANVARLNFSSAVYQIMNHMQLLSAGVKPYETIWYYAGNINSFIEIENGGILPAEKFYRPEVRLMLRCANNVICWTNDIFSLNVELHQPGQHLNMVTIYASQGNSWQQAIDCTAERIRGEINEFVRISRIIGSRGDKDLNAYVTGIQNWMRGHQDWIDYDTQRYSRTFAKDDADDRWVL